MNKLELVTGKSYLSHSSLTSYLDCSERFRLERVVKVPQEHSWWLVGGSAFHTASEYVDRDGQPPHEAWTKAWAEELAKVEDVGKLRAGGRATKEYPDRENGAWWTKHGEDMLHKYHKWITSRIAEGWSFFEPGVEVPVDFTLADVNVKGYVDRILVNPDGELMVIDLKTGSHTPASSMQLGIYSLGIEHHFGLKPSIGAYYMARKGELSNTMSLLHYSENTVGRWFSIVKKGIEEEMFVPHVTSMCGTCSVAPYCVAVGGKETL